MNESIMKNLYEKKEYYNYLKENSSWIKILKRNPEKYKDFIKFIKEKYKLRVQDKVKDAVDNISIIGDVLTSVK